jgi:hypothetical protein
MWVNLYWKIHLIIKVISYYFNSCCFNSGYYYIFRFDLVNFITLCDLADLRNITLPVVYSDLLVTKDERWVVTMLHYFKFTHLMENKFIFLLIILHIYDMWILYANLIMMRWHWRHKTQVLVLGFHLYVLDLQAETIPCLPKILHL